MIEKGRPEPGACFDGEGVNFAIYSAGAEAVELCLFDAANTETGRLALPHCNDGLWHGYLPGCQPGQRYGYRVHGHYAAEQGLRFNPNKLLIDPYARELSGEFSWSPAVFDYDLDFDHAGDVTRASQLDSAAHVQKSVVTSARTRATTQGPAIPWSDTIIYEANVRGYTMRHPDVPEFERGTFRGMTNASVLSYLQSLGITSIELMPVQEFIDEEFLYRQGLRNFWGYNTINFFAPARRYAHGNCREEFRSMVSAIHDAGMEVILDIAFNHTGEGGRLGPTLSFRGIDNLSYYRTPADDRGDYINDTGCGNTLDVDHPAVRSLVVDSLRYWSTEMGVDGFRFDLATVLGRSHDGFSHQHALLQAIEKDAVLRDKKLIAEPWDPGPGGYALGRFSSRWAEWNDKYRDSVRRYWRGDRGTAAEFAKRLLGSADIFESSDRGPCASINLLTAHDGYTLADLVSFEQRHNEANGEHNRDGHAHNLSHNYGIEGSTDDSAINEIRTKQKLNMLASLLTSQGTPMLLAGDEFGNSQQGNNNAYAQDNETGWLDWSGLDKDAEFRNAVRQIIILRKAIPLLRQQHFLHGSAAGRSGWRDVAWLRPDGKPMQAADWPEASALALFLSSSPPVPSDAVTAVAVLMNASNEAVDFLVPGDGGHAGWNTAFASAADARPNANGRGFRLPSRAFVCLTQAC